MKKNLPGLRNDPSGVEKTNIFQLQPLKGEVDAITLLFRISIVSFLAAFSLFFLVVILSLALGPRQAEIEVVSQSKVGNQVLGATTDTSSSNESFFAGVVRTIFSPLGRINQWLIKTSDKDTTAIVDPLTTKELNEIFELNKAGDVVVKKKLVLIETPISSLLPTYWTDVKGKPHLLSSINKVEGVAGNIKLAEGNNIEITNDESKNTITISSTGAATVTGNVGVDLTSGTGLSISGSTISNTNLGSSQNIFKNVAVSGQSTVVADGNNDTLTFAAGAGIAITTSAGNDRVTIASTGGAVSFDAVTAGTNTSALVIGTGGSLSISGSGTITATNLTAGSSVVSNAEVDDNITISAAGSVAAAAVTGSLTDAQVSNTLTIDGTGSVTWSALTSYPAACSAGDAITALAGSPTCSTFWYSGNDGTGSGLDADLIDGVSSASFAQKGAAETITGGWIFNTAATTFTTAINTNGGATTTAGDLALGSASGNINIGTSTLLGTTAVIDFSDFDVSNDGHITLTPDIIFPTANYMDIIAPSTFVASSTVINVYGISSAGDLSTTIDASGETIDWRAVNLTLPAINSAQEAADIINRVGILITAGAITAGAGTETSVAIDVSDADLVTALALGTNAVTVGGATISASEFALLDGHDAALVDTNDAVGTAITSTGALTSGSIAAGFGTISTANSISGTILTATTAASGLVIGTGVNATTLSSTATAARAISFPDEDGTICTTGSVCSGYQGSGSYAVTALSNLAAVAINTTLLPNAAGTIHLGSGTLPFGDIFLAGTSGTPETNNFRITGASTSGTRIITLPDESGALCTNTSVCSIYSPVAGSGSIVTVGALTSGSIAAGFGTISTSNTITGTTLNGTTGINSGAGAGTQRIDASGNLVNIGNITGSGALILASGGAAALTLDSASGVVTISAGDTLGNGTWSISSAGLGTSLTATDLSCTNCIGATEVDESTIASTGLSDGANIAHINAAESISGGWTFDTAATTFTTAIDVNAASTVAGLTIDGGGTLSVLGTDGSDDDFIYFDTGTAESLSWDDTPGEFDLSDNLHLAGTLIIDPNGIAGVTDFGANVSIVDVAPTLNPSATQATTSIFYDAGPILVLDEDLSGSTLVLYRSEISNLFGDTTTPNTLGTFRHYDTSLTTYDSGVYDNALTITNYTGLYIADPDLDNTGNTTGDLTITNPYGIYIEDFVAEGNGAFTNGPWAIYQAGADDLNYFAGSTNFGRTATGNDTTHQVVIQGSLCVDDSTANCPASAGGGRIYYDVANSVFDLAESFPTKQSLEGGDVVSVSPEAAGDKNYVIVSSKPYDETLVGVVSTDPSITFGSQGDRGVLLGQLGDKRPTGYAPVSLAGRVPVKVSTENGDISPGDPMTSSSVPGVAMKATKSGPIVGKALEGYTGSGTGKIMVFVSTGWYISPLADISQQIADLTDLNVETLTARTIQTDMLFIGDRKLDMAPDGSLVIDGSVNILGDLKVEGELTAEKLNVSDKAAGSSTLASGETKIFIETSLITDKSQVLITLNTLTEKAIAVTKKEGGKGFTVEISAPEAKDIDFDWFIVN